MNETIITIITDIRVLNIGMLFFLVHYLRDFISTPIITYRGESLYDEIYNIILSSALKSLLVIGFLGFISHVTSASLIYAIIGYVCIATWSLIQEIIYLTESNKNSSKYLDESRNDSVKEMKRYQKNSIIVGLAFFLPLLIFSMIGVVHLETTFFLYELCMGYILSVFGAFVVSNMYLMITTRTKLMKTKNDIQLSICIRDMHYQSITRLIMSGLCFLISFVILIALI